MQYRRLGQSGLQVSELSLGSWVTYHNQVDATAAREMLAAAFDAGINFFDNAEVYANGQSEIVMGQAIKALNWPRLSYIISTKFFWGLNKPGPTMAPCSAWAWISSTWSTACDLIQSRQLRKRSGP